MVVLVTGATGFLGNAILTRCEAASTFQLRGSLRHDSRRIGADVESVIVGDLAEDTNWDDALKGVDVVVHTAARVHLMHDAAVNPLAEFRRVNVAGTLNLARQAAEAGVQRLIFISSIKVNGERTAPGESFTADDVPAPMDPYGISKLEAEQGLRALALDTGMEVVIIRPVLIYGPGVKANFRSMMRWVHQGVPLPLGGIHNRRSFVSLDNLTHLILTCLHHPAAANQTFLVSDGDDMSTPELLRRLAIAMGTRTRLLPVPASLLRTAMRLVGKGDTALRLCASLQVNIRKTRELLGWTPLVSVDYALKQTALSFLQLRTVSSHGSAPLGGEKQPREQ